MASAPRDENSRLDAIAHARMLTELGYMTQEEGARTVDLPRANFRRVMNGEVAPKIDISGLTAAVIRELYQTASGVAVRCQMAEHDLRMADLDQCAASAALGLIPAAEAVVVAIETGDRSRFESVDNLALASLKAQIALYKARVVTPNAAREALLRAAFNILDRQSDAIIRLVVLGAQTCDIDKLLGLRMLMNLYFAAAELDEISREDLRLPRAKEVAARLSDGDFLVGARRVAQLIRDPRLSYQLADAAALTGQFWASANLLADSMRLTGHDPALPRSWSPLWLVVRITAEPHFGEPIAILERGQSLT